MDDVDAWYAVMAPGKTPAALVARLNADVNAVMALPDVREQLLRQGLIPVTSTPGELAGLIKADLARWGKVVKDANIKVD
jgi:tripartite-type tricarboxylate transporter receptor subunit TctC